MSYWNPGVSKQLCHYKGPPSPVEVATQSLELLFSLLAPPTIMAAMGQEMVMAETQEVDPLTSMFSLSLLVATLHLTVDFAVTVEVYLFCCNEHEGWGQVISAP